MALMALTATGCAVSSSTLVRPDKGGSQVIYRISEEQAAYLRARNFSHLFSWHSASRHRMADCHLASLVPRDRLSVK